MANAPRTAKENEKEREMRDVEVCIHEGALDLSQARKHKTQNTKHKTQNTKHKTQNTKHKTQNTKRDTIHPTTHTSQSDSQSDTGNPNHVVSWHDPCGESVTTHLSNTHSLSFPPFAAPTHQKGRDRHQRDARDERDLPPESETQIQYQNTRANAHIHTHTHTQSQSKRKRADLSPM